MSDSIVDTIVSRFIERAAFGKKKYGTTLDRTDLNLTEWIQHLQDELHDAYLYSEKLKQDTAKKDRLLELAILCLRHYKAVVLIWQDGDEKYPEDYEMELDQLLEWYDSKTK